MKWRSLAVKYILNNGSYKLVAFFVSLVLWITLLGRTDLILNHEMKLQLLTKPNHIVVNKVRKMVEVKLSGPRTGLKKFTLTEKILTLNLNKLEVGTSVIKINKDVFNLPVGVNVISVKPEVIKVVIKEVKPRT